MKTEYRAWITERYTTPESAKLQCAEATKEMVAAFPELRRVRGHAMVGVDLRPHWWCLTTDGKIIDPTAHQWDQPPVFYDMIPEGAEEPHGKCLECGDLLYYSQGDNSHFCKDCPPRL